jgi:hypothetical protein
MALDANQGENEAIHRVFDARLQALPRGSTQCPCLRARSAPF